MRFLDRIERAFMQCDRLRVAWISLGIVALLVLALQNNKHGFEWGHHGYLSSHGSTIAANLSPQTRFLMLNRVVLNERGETEYQIYGRFPVASFLVIKAAMLLAGSDLSMQIHYARQTMNIFFIGAMICIFLASHRLCKSPLIALAVTLMSFSSWFMLNFNDMIFNDIPALFGLSLVIHGIMVFLAEERRHQLYVKGAIGVALGWQVYGAVFAFVICGLAWELIQHRSWRTLWQGPHIRLALTTVLVGSFFLGLNVVNEALTAAQPLGKLPTLQAAAGRFGGNQGLVDQFGWGDFLWFEFVRIQGLARPCGFALPVPVGVYGIVVAGIIALGFRLLKPRLFLIVLILSGLLWSIPMRHFTAHHEFQAVFYVGVVLVFFCTTMVLLDRVWKGFRLICAVSAFTAFCVSLVVMNGQKSDVAQEVNVVTRDFQSIREVLSEGDTIAVDGEYATVAKAAHAPGFYLATYPFADKDRASYVISKNRQHNTARVTPNTIHTHLFLNLKQTLGWGSEGDPLVKDFRVIQDFLAKNDRVAIHGREKDITRGRLPLSNYLPGVKFGAITNAPYVLSVSPRYSPASVSDETLHAHLFLNLDVLMDEPHLAGNAVFDVYRKNEWLIYVRAKCTKKDIIARFFLECWDEDGRAPKVSEVFDGRKTAFKRRGKAVIIKRLPRVPCSKVRTGQAQSNGDIVWDVTFDIRGLNGGSHSR